MLAVRFEATRRVKIRTLSNKASSLPLSSSPEMPGPYGGIEKDKLGRVNAPPFQLLHLHPPSVIGSDLNAPNLTTT